ncbi:MAG: hypothetical protein VX265_09670 [Myxococcota bacterium]|nr:hypothetical protein [Myxococcota bacterium]
MSWLLSLSACFGPPEPACPPGMVRVTGAGEVGLDPAAYALVQTAGRAVVDAPEAECPAARAREPESIACWVQTDEVDPVLRPRTVETSDFCIEPFPFPGEGSGWTADGMTAWDAQALERMLASGRFGTRRLCTMTEFQLAVAGPVSNRPFVYGAAQDPARCPADGKIGADPSCSNSETGVHDYGAVRSHWVRADPAFIAEACDEPPCRGAGRRPLTEGHYIVAGGTARVQTRQAPLTPHTWHDHGVPNPAGCDAMGHDDQPVICADPSEAYGGLLGPDAAAADGERAWMALVQLARASGSMTQMLEAGLGESVCPASEP